MTVILLLLAACAALASPRHCPAHVSGVGCHHVCDLPPGAHRHHCPRCGSHWATLRIGGEEAG